MFNFKEWFNGEEFYRLLVEMAMGDVMRVPVPMDQEDADFLWDYHKTDWPEMLSWRYSTALKEAIIPSHDKVEIKPSTDSSIKRLIKRLEDLGFDLRNTNPDDPWNLEGMVLMSIPQAANILNGANKKMGWIRWSAKQLGIEPPIFRGSKREGINQAFEDWANKEGKYADREGPEFRLLPQPLSRAGEYQLWTPNWTKAQQLGYTYNDPDRVEINDQMRQEIEKDVSAGIDRALSNIKNSKRWRHSYNGMIESMDWIFDAMMEFFTNNTKDPRNIDRKWRIEYTNQRVTRMADMDWGKGSYRHRSHSAEIGLLNRDILARRGRGRPRRDYKLNMAKTPYETGAHLLKSPLYKQADPEPMTACQRCGGTEVDYDVDGEHCAKCGLPVMKNSEYKKWLAQQGHGQQLRHAI